MPREGVSLDDAFIERICMLIRSGLTWRVASETLGVNHRTVLMWRSMGAEEIDRRTEGMDPRAQREIHVDLVERLARAKAQAEEALVLRIQQIARGGDTRKRTTTTTTSGGTAKAAPRVQTTVVEETFRPEWTAAAWLLERHPEFHLRWRRKDRLDVSVDQGALVQAFADVLGKVAADPELALTPAQVVRYRAVVADELRVLQPEEAQA